MYSGFIAVSAAPIIMVLYACSPAYESVFKRSFLFLFPVIRATAMFYFGFHQHLAGIIRMAIDSLLFYYIYIRLKIYRR